MEKQSWESTTTESNSILPLYERAFRQRSHFPSSQSRSAFEFLALHTWACFASPAEGSRSALIQQQAGRDPDELQMHHATLLWKINGIFRFLLSPVENKKSHFPAQGCKNMMSKRHPSLVPLAREHHEGLLLAVRLQQGKKALLRLWSHDPHWQAGYVVEFYEKHLRTHFMAEEQGLFPIAEGIKACKPHVDELLLHHRTLVEQVDRFRQPTRVRLDDALHAFGALLEEHIRKEDRVLFPLFEKHATQEMLRQVDISIKRFYPPDPPGHTTSSS